MACSRKFAVFLLVAGIAGAIPAHHSSAQSAAQAPFTVTITAPHPTIKVGEPAMIHIVLKDTSEGQLTMPEERHVGTRGEMNYRITVERSDGSPVPDTELGREIKNGTAGMHHSVLVKDLNFGEEVAEDADLNNVVKITVPGEYVVQVERADRLYAASHIKSNKITITVTP